jgi:hypothetical protein
MKIIKFFSCALLFLAAFILGCFLFAPFDEAGELALAYARLAAARRGYYITFDDFSRSGILNPSYKITSLDVEGPMTKITFSEMNATVLTLPSLLSRQARARVRFSETGVLFVPNNSLTITSGAMNLSTDGRHVYVADAAVEGDVRFAGDITFDMKSGEITESTATLSVPPLINALLGSQAAASFVEPVSPGEWRIKSNARR